MKLKLTIVLFSFAIQAMAQETMQTVTDRGNTTSNGVITTSQEGFSNHKLTDKTILSSFKGSVRSWQVDDVAGDFRLYVDGTYNGYNFNVLSNGLVGIGTSSPSAKLNVVDVLGGAGGGALIIGKTNESNLRFGVNTGYSWMQSHGGQPLRINELGNDILLNLGDGNVGIGMGNPAEKLAVNGNIRAKEIKVETTNWPDYVFKGDYELLSLDELKTYIKKNGHLPDVPSAESIEKYGLSLGEMNRSLLKKVEEITLYLLEKDEELKKERQTGLVQHEMLKKMASALQEMNRRLEIVERK